MDGRRPRFGLGGARVRGRLGALVALLVLAAGPARSATYTVTNTNTSGAGSLAQAISDANANVGLDTIVFAIPGAGVHTISPTSSPPRLLPVISNPVIIDGTTQAGYGSTPLIEIDGTSAGATDGLVLGAGSSGSTIRALAVNRFGGGRAGIRIQGGSSGNVVVGCHLGTDPSGTAARPNGVGVIINGATNNQIGGTGTSPPDRNVISGNAVDGMQLYGATTTGNVIQGNYIGLNAAGTAPLANSQQGVSIYSGSANNTVGGTAVGAGNVISGNGNIGVAINSAGTTGNVVQGNRIGTDWTGTAVVSNVSQGVSFDAGANNNTVGGTAAGAGNTIAHNGRAGVLVAGGTVGIGILGNAIFDNSSAGIDLNGNGVDLNDTGDPDSGSNNLQNHPVLSAAMTDSAGFATFAGSYNSAASTAYRIEFFASAVVDVTGYGEGERYLGSTSVTTDASGNAVIGVTLATTLNAGEFVTATATSPSNNTSEFGGAVQAFKSLVVTTTADTVDGATGSVLALIANPGADGRISLREAITAANAATDTDIIRFGIPITDGGHVYYQDNGVTGSFAAPTATTLADVSTPSSPTIPAAAYDADYPAGLARSWYRIQVGSGGLPYVTGAAVIDAASEPLSPAGAPVIELDGSLAGASAGLRISAGGSTVRGLVVNRFQQYGILLETGAGNTIVGNIIGLDVAGVTNLGNVLYGVNMVGSNNNVIGGTTAADRNVISSNRLGVNVGATSQNELIQGNYIGTDVTGTRAFGNTFDGVWVQSTAGPSTIGGTAPGAGNLISGNGEDGISINGTANGMVVQGNRIGTDVTGLLDRGNAVIGIHLGAGNNHVVGGTSAAARNVICGSGANGMLIPAGTGSTIQGNYIGVGADGATKIANAPNGIDVTGTGTVIGGTAPGAGNVISGNTQSGVYINGANGVVVQGNTIGMDAARTVAVGNQSGVWIGPGTVNSLVGGTTAAAANLIAYNTYVGIGTGATAGSGNAFIGNSIYLNSALGIDLLDNGVTLNDALDVDTGPNDLLNFPQFPPPVESVAGTLSVTYGLDLPMGWYRIEFFKNPIGADPSGYGEGQVFASSVVVYHPGGAPAAYSHSFPGSTGEVVSATTTACTDGAACAAPGSTSEFSRAWAAVPTAVELLSFTATGGNGSVDLEWQTGTELNNLGFHLHRGPSKSGPWTRITPSLIPGLGSSPVGASYSWRDVGLVNGTRYYYRLEDVDAASVSTFHGPVSAVPSAPGEDGGDGGGADGTERGGPGISSCPTWVLAAAPDAVSPTCTRHGSPESVSLDVLSRDAASATLELRTGGFWALHDDARTVRVFVPGLEFPTDPRAPALPLRRVLVDAVVGKRVELVSAEAFDLRAFRGLRPSAAGIPEMAVGRDGTVRPSRRSLGAPVSSRGYLPKEVARLAGTVFQGERKSAVVEITPVRFAGQGLLLAGRVRVSLAFTGVEEGESGTGSRGRAAPRRGAARRDMVAQLYTTRRGVHAVTFGQLFPQGGRALSTAFLRLQRQGEAVAFHVEPSGAVFGPGSVLFFFADRTASSTDYTSEVAYELVRSPGVQMGVVTAAPVGEPASSSSLGLASFETNRIYQPGLLEAPDVWLWQAALSTAEAPAPVSFSLSGLSVGSVEPVRLVVYLQGGSASGRAVDHHVRVLVNGVLAGETVFAGKQPSRVEMSVPASVLADGANELAIVNVADTGVVSLVFLDRFELSYPQVSTARAGVFEGAWAEGGAVEVGGLSGLPVILRDRGGVRWVRGFETSPGSVRFQAEAGDRYLVASPEGLLSPRIGRIPLSTLRDRGNQADYVLIAPREFVGTAQPLLERRRSQGLVSRVASLEEIASEFGHGQPSGEAIRAFLSYAYHSWQRPSPRYVLLVGDSTADPRRFVSTSGPSPLPALWTRTSYLWTVSDPGLGAVNGEDVVPDLAIGRLPAATVEEAQRLVSKVLAWEETGQGLSGEAVLVADNPDRGGDFEADVEDVRASFLAGRATTVLKVSELGGGTRPAILGAFDEGVSLMSYVGHGGTTVWASENVLNNWDVPALRGQSRQPLLLTLDCLNGYFVTPNLDSLPEALLKAEGRGVIAAFSPSGLSLDGPAHQYHRAVMAELTSGAHQRLGDAILAAQKTYAETGLMPELLAVYHLLGDPATRIREP